MSDAPEVRDASDASAAGAAGAASDASAGDRIALELDRVTVRRERRVVLDRVSLTVAPGTVHAVVGPNGAGKSTLIAAVLGQVAFEGRIRLHLRGNGRVAYVPQGFDADRTLPITIAEFLALPRQRRPICFGVARALRPRIGALLERVGLAGMERRRLGELSGGELRRVLIANALEPSPEVLLCDEPATGLAADAVGQLDRLLRELARDAGAAVLLVSHDAAQVERVADRCTLLEIAVKATGRPAEILDRPDGPFAGRRAIAALAALAASGAPAAGPGGAA
ncbi:MAG TPA: ATP-binding cassette domain-containing protein [Kofleriaceae bacterium]|nr:ATP-binding cassette domain-containing protein [Kofleriaceae bacterium]